MLYSCHFLSQQSYLLSQQSLSVNLQPFILRQMKDCRNQVPLPFAFIIVAIELRVLRQSSFNSSSAMLLQRFYFCLEFSLDFVATYSCWLRHSFLVFLKFCRDKQKLCRDRECCNCTFFLLLCWNYLIFN